MARVTIEDCLEMVENRFALVHATATRTKQLYNGSAPRVICDNREVVEALREIADGCVKVTMEAEVEEKAKKKK